ncbi:permease-like cell division protein FtsX [Parenemella sanctibonifatiensis]|uniref:Cell division protein FtsX n=1 Tax=Parenemella sanctibonifatiensis TaxID=2016505 RepID=A0A255EH63_9ACTN|nr:permease-like cell division protein FtsX [Parenemella sanctibonifatiensis]OYN90866.1 cell division protein [Parenemella sanctibonifatiensis]
MRHTFSETWSGLRRNVSMTIAVIVTMWVSLALFGAGLMASQQVELMKGNWYDRIEISVFLCSTYAGGQNCDPGADGLSQDVTDAQKQEIEAALRANPEVEEVFFESKEQAYAEFQEAFEGNPVVDSVTVDQMQESYRIKLKDPQQYEGVVSQMQSTRGVQAVQDMREYLDPFFNALNVVQVGTWVASGLLLLAAALQIANTIRIAAFSRRRELGIMRLVGASNFSIMLPFLLESLVAALIGAVLACATLAGILHFGIIEQAQVSLQALPWIGWAEAGLAMVGVAVVGIVLAIIPTVIATRQYLRV